MPIKVNNLFHTYLKRSPQKVEALRGINIEIPDHSYIALLGETGSGKSTLAQHLNALLLPDSGEIIVDDYVITPKKRKNKKIHELRKHIGMVFQFPEYQLFEETVEKDVAFGPLNFGSSKEEALKLAHEALSKVGLDESYYLRSPFELSGGERRRVALAGIFAIKPDILVLDEPTVGLDHQGSKDIMNLVNKMYDEGTSIILITHDMNLVNEYVQKVFFLEDGEIKFVGKPTELFANKEINIEVPNLYRFVNALNDSGYDIDLNKIKTLKDVVPYLRRKS
ncbi:MAG: energy-coupling factor transporter ATPase [Bacilli bacterium]|nr:energy-coupling factor transporter ATPase [Bacilli bacterium]